jgi:hypothetical protein
MNYYETGYVGKYQSKVKVRKEICYIVNTTSQDFAVTSMDISKTDKWLKHYPKN